MKTKALILFLILASFCFGQVDYHSVIARKTAVFDSTNLIPSASSDFATDGTGWWYAQNCNITYNGDPDYNATATYTSGAAYFGFRKLGLIESGLKYRVRFKAKSTVLTDPFHTLYGNLTFSANPNLTGSFQNYEYITSSQNDVWIVVDATSDSFVVDDITAWRTP